MYFSFPSEIVFVLDSVSLRMCDNKSLRRPYFRFADNVRLALPNKKWNFWGIVLLISFSYFEKKKNKKKKSESVDLVPTQYSFEY